ncbi:MAG: hypothetical protein F6K39_30285 [Okeania sp. SIO3B3]|nr:hypothetical protein [Okeania sp. SIO3B3]
MVAKEAFKTFDNLSLDIEKLIDLTQKAFDSNTIPFIGFKEDILDSGIALDEPGIANQYAKETGE